MSYRFVRYHPKYQEGVVQLQTALWSPDLATNANYLTWKYEQNPYLDEPLIYLALYKERVVGMRGLCGARWEIGHTGQSVSMPCAGDTTTDPEHRGRGLARQILQLTQTDTALAVFPYMLGLSAAAPVYFCALSEGWRLIGPYGTMLHPTPLSTMVKPGRLKNVAQRLRRHSSIEKLFSTITQLWHPHVTLGHIQVSTEPRPADMASLVERTEKLDKIRHVRDQRYYAWRFRSPLSSYRFFYWQKNTLDGFLVLQKSILSATGPTHIVEWEATNREVLTELLQAAVHDVGFGSMETWAATLSDEMLKVFCAYGFTKIESHLPEGAYRPSILGRCLNAALLDKEWRLAGRLLTDLDNWDLRMVYSDQY
jgi:GNAT superfamily N-acetyltransferase